MKKFKPLKTLGILSILCLCGVQANAAYTPAVGASLTRDKKTVTSSYKLLDASYMYGETMSSSKYNVEYIAKGSNNGTSFTNVKTVTYAPSTSGTVNIDKEYNYWKITLTGRNNKGNKTKKCIAFGKVSE